MRVDQLDYALAPESIAQAPASDRHEARLLVVPPGEAELRHARIRDLAELIPEGAVVVVNDTRVQKARLLGRKVGSGGKAELFLVRRLGDGDHGENDERWLAMGKASKGLAPGMTIDCGGLEARVLERRETLLEIVLSVRSGTVTAAIEAVGHVPLPPYIRRADTPEDRDRYQTLFARVDGAVAAPTAGLHLTPELVAEIEGRGATIAPLTLHVGLGTFQPVTVADLDDHPMHSEALDIPVTTAAAIDAARDRGVPVVAIGTTVVRALEASHDPARPGRVLPGSRETRLLIQPGYKFHVTDLLLTNFHVPQSTLLALVAAFAGHARVLAAYRAAQAAGYRFLSYGDAMFVHPTSS